METIDITKNIKRLIKYGLIGMIALSTAIGGAAFKYQHREDTININNAKVAGTMVSVRVLTNGKIKELTKADGDEVKAGDVIAKIEVSVTDEQIAQLESAVDQAKKNYAQLEVGQMVKVPIRKPKVKTIQVPGSTATQRSSTRSGNSSASLAALEERKNRMELLYEMGAISRKEMEAAVREYELAKASAGSSAETESTIETPPTTQEVIEYEIEYVDQLQPTPPEILKGAQLAIKQAELSLNVARQEAQQTEVIAPVDGVIYYGVEVDEEIKAGDVVARVGDSNELWLEAEVTESQFEKISLGKLVSYSINGNKLTGTVIEKIAPSNEEITTDQIEKPIESVENPATNENIQPEVNQNQPAMNEDQHNGQGGPISGIKIAQAEAEQSTDNDSKNVIANEILDQVVNENPPKDQAVNDQPNAENQPVDQPSLNVPVEDQNPALKDKFIVKFSLPAERNFECKPNMTVAVTVNL